MKRVVITGIGAVTPLGLTFMHSWTSVRSGVSGIALTRKIADPPRKWRSAGEIKGMDPGSHLSVKEINSIDPFMTYAFFAASEALETSCLSNAANLLEHSAVIVGSSRGGITTIEKNCLKMAARLRDPHMRLSPHLMPSTTIGAAASFIAMKLGIKGYCLGISNACASGSIAVGEAYRLIRSGYASIAFAGGSEAPLCRLCAQGYGASGALSKSDPAFASRPFDQKRDGFVLAEGACIVVLEEMHSALSRNAPIFGEIIGYGNICDASHMTRPSAEGETRAIKSATADAGISAADVDYINAHGTSTVIGDRVESVAIRNFFAKSRVPVSSLKSMTGHMLAASGAFEIACTAMSIKEGIIPPTINTRDIDSGCDIDVITKPTRAPIEIALTNSFGFGGINAVLVLKKFST